MIKNNPLLHATIYSCLLSTALPVHGFERLFDFNAITIQQGHDFEVGDSTRQIATLEHYSLWDWGDFYAFYDRIREDKSHRLSYYSEWSPRLSLSLLGLNTRSNWFKDVLIATTYENGANDFEAYLIGPGVTWNVPWFAHLETNLYYRDTHNQPGSTWQITAAWALPFKTGPIHWVFDGYTDIRGSEGNVKSDVNFNPQIKIDLGRFFDLPEHIYAGIEYYHWDNKFGIEGINERVVSPLLQVRFSF